MEEQRTRWYYDELKRYYLKTDSDWTDKSKSIRTIADDFYHELSGSYGTFHEVLKEFYKWNHNKVVADAAFTLKERLNDVVHHNRHVDKQMYINYYSTLVRLIYISTGVYPDKATEEYLGLTQDNRLEGLNDQQKDAVLCDSQIIYVNAGPGTGKTHLLVNKLLQYIYNSTVKESIVALSYTNTAANELGEKFYTKVFNCKVNKEYDFYNGTIHAFCFKILKSYHAQAELPFNYIIIDDTDIQELAEELRIRLDMKYTFEDIAICLKSKLKSKKPELVEIIEEIKERYNIISIEDILYKFIDAMSESKFCEWLRNQVSVLVVDEAQDLAALNYTIIEKILSVRPDLKLFLVGDPRQNIFSFNGGSYQHLNDFLLRHQNYTQKSLSTTYRCPESVNRYVNTFMFDDCENIQIQSNSGKEGNVSLVSYTDVAQEFSGVLESVLSMGRLRDSAVLCNTLKYLKGFLALLNQKSVPYKVFGGQRVVKTHVKVFNHILRVIDSENEYSIAKLANWSHVTLRNYPGSNQRERFYHTSLGRIIFDIRYTINHDGRSLHDVFHDVADILLRYYSENDAIEDLTRLQELSAGYDNLASFLLAFAIDKETFASFYEKNFEECTTVVGDDWLTVSTVHSAKGLEWENVFVLGLFEGNFPNGWFVRNNTEAEKARYFNECSKSMYVAATRTKSNLVLSYPVHNDWNQVTTPSRFIQALL